MNSGLLIAFAIGFVIALVASKIIRIIVGLGIFAGAGLLIYLRFFT